MNTIPNRLVLGCLLGLAACSAPPPERTDAISRGEALVTSTTVDATWTVTARSWNDSGVIGPQSTTLPVQVHFVQQAGVWTASVDSFNADLGGGMKGSLQQGKIATGTIDGDSATMTLPLHVTSPLASFDVDIPLGTGTTIHPPNAAAQSGAPYDGKDVAAVGSGVGTKVLLLGRGVTVFLDLSGPISAWP